MYIYQNGNRCPCCGEQLHDMTERELEMFSELCAVTGMEPLPEKALDLEPIHIKPPPDAGIYPPVKPVLDM